MDTEKFQKLSGDLVAYVTEIFPSNWARDQGMCRLQEAIWWWNKSLTDQVEIDKRKEANGNSKTPHQIAPA